MFEVSNLALEEGETEKKEWGHKLTGREKERKRDVVLMIILRSISAEESKNVEIDTTILYLACIYIISPCTSPMFHKSKPSSNDTGRKRN